MERNIQLALILLTIPAVFSMEHKYCHLESCPNRTHTLCQYPRVGSVSRCGQPVRFGFTGEELLEVIQMYNRNRPSEHAIKWDIELADIAQRWAYQCRNQCDTCRHVERFHVRQRVGFQWTRIIYPPPSIYSLISHWLAEDSLLSLHFENLSLSHVSSFESNYYSRFMLLNANKFGCGTVRSFDERFHYLHLVCNFGPD